jgi:hypothetical protein
MASERDLELLDDYLTNRLDERGRTEVEVKLESDPEFRQEFEHQQRVVQGIREARSAELKALLNNVPVSALPAEPSTWAIKLIAGLFAAGFTAMVLYYYFEHRELRDSTVSDSSQVEESSAVTPEDSTSAHDSASSSTDTPPTKTDEVSVPKPLAPDSRTPAPETDIELQKERDLIPIVSRTFVTSSTEVITESNDEQHTFHYAFRNRKLVLFGAFQKDQYQILEFITNKEHIFFLHYSQNYYLLDENTTIPTPLVPIRDPGLWQKLREFRTN